MKELNETCNKCACYSWGCPADYWEDDGTPIKECGDGKSEVITGFCFELKKEV
jgi:hypothetical protein